MVDWKILKMAIPSVMQKVSWMVDQKVSMMALL